MNKMKITKQDFFKVSGLRHIPSEFADWFPDSDYKQNGLDAIKEIAEFYHENRKYPSKYAKDDSVRRLAVKLSHLKQAKKGKNKCKWYPEYEMEANKLNCHDMFKDIDHKKNALDDIRLIAEFYHKNGKYPKQQSNDTEEKRLAKKRSNWKLAKKGNGKGLGKWYPEYEQYANKLKCTDMF